VTTPGALSRGHEDRPSQTLRPSCTTAIGGEECFVKRRSGLGIAFGLLAAITVPAATLAAFTGLANGSFETGTYADAAAPFQQLDAPNSDIDGWTVDAGSVDWIKSYWTAADGEMSIDMSGASAGAISQTFDTTIGNTYTVSFWMSGNPDDQANTIKDLDVSATGGTVTSYTYDVAGNARDNMNWTEETYTFLATSATTTLSFVSQTATAFGPAIDNVSVSESVPEKNDCKNGGWESMIDNQGNSFKNQGDCVSYFATKGKNLGAVPPVTEAASAADAATAADKHSSKHADKLTSRQSTERHAPKDKSHAKGGSSSKGHKSK
jgi:choice-of-anchor C domain-containing protein